jgi:hypothetical protein
MNPASDVPSATILDSPKRRLVGFLLGLLVMVSAIELGIRCNESLFEAATHRALAKAAIFSMHPRVEVLFLGTSRTQDGVNPELASRAANETSPELGSLPGFNAAFTGSSLDALLALVPRLGFRRDLHLVVVELSEPQIINEPAPWEDHPFTPTTLEERLGRQMRHLALVRHRKAFLREGLGRLPALLVFGESLGGWETKGSQQIASWLGRKEPPASNFDSSLWIPRRFAGDTPEHPLTSPRGAAADRLAEVAQRFRERGIRVLFAVPPLSANATNAPERKDLQTLFAEVARRSRCEVWDYTAARPPEGLFKDAGHLNREGRAHYSRALGNRLAEALKDR